ncbi:unnamed protein product, partial [Durusdinium trenchii]
MVYGRYTVVYGLNWPDAANEYGRSLTVVEGTHKKVRGPHYKIDCPTYHEQRLQQRTQNRKGKGSGKGNRPRPWDQMLSASWALFRDRGLSQTPLELPMTKAAVKAMDVIGNAVRGIVPIARAINLGAVWARTQRQLGGFPMVTQDYVEKH